MKLSYERDMSHNYMVPETENTDDPQNWQIQMLTENQISGLLRCTVKKVNCRSRYCYDITSRQSMAQIYETQAIQIREIRKLLGCLYRTLRETEKYLLDADRIVLEPQCIYLDMETGEAWFCYLPEYHADLEEALRKLTSWFLGHLDQQDSVSVLQGYELYRKAREQQGGIQELLRFAMADSGENSGVMWTEKNTQAKEERCRQDEGQKIEEQKAEFCQEIGGVQERIGREPGGQTPLKKEKEDEIQEKAEKEKGKSVFLTVRRKKKGKTEENKKEKRKFWMFPAAVLLGMTAVTAAGVWAGILTVTQAGEVTFLAAGLAVYGVSVQKKKQNEEESGKGDQAYRREQKAERRRQKREKRMLRRQKGAGKKQMDQKEEAENSIGATTLLWEGTEDYEPRLTLLSMNSRDRQSVVLMNDSYLIGKLKSKADVLIDDPAVSRIHARIRKQGEDYYLQDLNSTNGTFLNGRRLEAQEEIRIQEGDEITFAETGYYVGKC